MSQVFSVAVEANSLPSIAHFIGEISAGWTELLSDVPELEETVMLICPQWNEEHGDQWLEDTSYMFYLSNISTRGLEVWYKDGIFSVRVMSMSCAQEWSLAFDMITIAGEFEDVIVSTDTPDGDVMLGVLRDVFDDVWIDAIVAEHFEKVFAAIAGGADSLEFDGPLRSFYIGPWLVHRLHEAFPDLEQSCEDMIDLVFDMMRIVQYFFTRPSFSAFDVPEAVTWKNSDGTESSGALLRAGTGLYVPDLDFLVFPHGRDNFIALPSSEFKAQLQPTLTEVKEVFWLDEIQFALFPLTEKRLAAVAKAVAPACIKVNLQSSSGF